MVLSRSVADKIESDMDDWMDDFLARLESGHGRRAAPDGAKPFHEALLPVSLMRMSGFERSFSTLLGKSYERHSAIMAEPNFAEVKLQHKTEGSLLEAVDTEISDEVGRINSNRRVSDYPALVERIVEMEMSGSGKKVNRSVTSDLYLKSDSGAEVFFEIKTPKPNKEQCLNITRKHLWIHAILRRVHPVASTYFGMAYNPYGEGNDYKHSFAVNYLDAGSQTLIGRQYWDFLGGRGAFDELMGIYRKVGSKKYGSIRRMLDD